MNPPNPRKKTQMVSQNSSPIQTPQIMDSGNPALPGNTDLALSGITLPGIIIDAGPRASERFIEFFTARIPNDNTREAYGRAVGRFLT